MSDNIRPIVLLILDGWGVAPPSQGNAIQLAKKPFFDSLIASYPIYLLQASGESVGLMWGEMGNSEVGHLTIGSGRIIYQNIARIHKSILSGEFFRNSAFLHAAEHVRKYQSTLHLIGLVSNGGVHSHQDHLHALLDFCRKQKIAKVCIHAILDGRDTERDSGLNAVRALLEKIHDVGVGEIRTLSGRFYAMDRDHHWERTEAAYRAIAEGKSKNVAQNPLQAIEESYKKHVYDEMFPPTVIQAKQSPYTGIHQNDAIIFFNFRADRARQLTQAFTIPGFEKFSRSYLPNVLFITFTEYDKDFPVEIAFPPISVNKTLAEVISEHNLLQLHAAETEKYAHVTYFFNGGKEESEKNEERILIPSPPVTSYDQVPEMSVYELTKRIISEIKKKKYHFIVLNFANADMVGHTGNLQATIKAIQAIDECIKHLTQTILEHNGVFFITADHGNAEEMINIQTGEIIKEHSKNPVPFIIIGNDFQGKGSQNEFGLVNNDLSILTPSGMLTDIAPTILHVMNIEKPKEMSGTSLIFL